MYKRPLLSILLVSIVLTNFFQLCVLAKDSDKTDSKAEYNNSFVGKELYTQTNLRVIRGRKESRVIPVDGRIYPNLEILPLGLRATWVKKSRRGSLFVIDGKEYTVSHGGSYSFVEPSTARRVNRAINIGSPKLIFDKLPKKEKQLVRAGKIKAGMSRNAVLLSLGCPENLNSEQMESIRGWTYHLRKFNAAMTVVFDDDWRVKSINSPGQMHAVPLPPQSVPPPEEHFLGKKLFVQTNLRNIPLKGGYNEIKTNGQFTPDALTLPVGKKATYVGVQRGYYVFESDGKLYHVKTRGITHYYNPSVTSRIERLFSTNDPNKALASLSKHERELIAKRKVEIGMSKQSVVFSLGYPCNLNRLQTNSNDSWEYIWDRQTMYVIFQDGKVSAISNPPPY